MSCDCRANNWLLYCCEKKKKSRQTNGHFFSFLKVRFDFLVRETIFFNSLQFEDKSLSDIEKNKRKLGIQRNG